MILLDYWWLVIPGILLGLYAQIKVSSTYRRFLQVASSRGLTGAEAARMILDHYGLSHVAVEEIGGMLTDHYDPTRRVLRLSSENYHGTSLAALGVAAHEAGHALQHKDAYAPLNLRMAMVPITQFASYAWSGIILLGFLLGQFYQFLGIAIGIFIIITLFQLITLPVEFNASSRAKAQLLSLGLISPREEPAVSKVLNAAALTYVAAMITSLLQLLQLILIARDRD